MSSVPPPAAAAAPLEVHRQAAVWQGSWALAVILAAGLMLTVLGELPSGALAALALGAAPGVLGFFWRPQDVGDRRGLLALWALGSGLALAFSGGLTGPLAIWAAAPLLAAIALGGLWFEGAALAFAVLGAVAAVQAGGRLPPPPAGPAGFALAIAALAIGVAGAAGALMLRLPGPHAGAAARPAAAEPKLQARLEAAEGARAAAEADARGKMRFLANMSHELRTPLNAIMGPSPTSCARGCSASCRPSMPSTPS